MFNKRFKMNTNKTSSKKKDENWERYQKKQAEEKDKSIGTSLGDVLSGVKFDN